MLFKIKRKSPLKKLMDVYAKRLGEPTAACCFVFLLRHSLAVGASLHLAAGRG